MTKYASPDLVLKLANSGGTLQDMSQYVDTFNGLNVEAKIQEHVPFGASWVGQLYAGVKQGEPMTWEGFYDDTATTGPDVIFNALGDTRAFEITWGGTKKSSGSVIITNYNRVPTSGEKTRYTVTLTPTGAITEA